MRAQSKCSFTTRKLRFFGRFCLALPASPTFFNGLLLLAPEGLKQNLQQENWDDMQGFGIQRVYTEDGSLDETMAVKNHDVTLVPRGHTNRLSAMLPTHTSTVRAGPMRSM